MEKTSNANRDNSNELELAKAVLRRLPKDAQITSVAFKIGKSVPVDAFYNHDLETWDIFIGNPPFDHISYLDVEVK